MGNSRAERRRRQKGQAKRRPADTLDYIRTHFSPTEGLSDLLVQARRAQDSGNPDALFHTAEQLWSRFPDFPETHLTLAVAAHLQGYLALFVHSLRTVVDRWPEHEDTPSARQRLAKMEEILDCRKNPTPIETGAQQEWMQWYLATDRPAQARDLALQVLKTAPQDLPSLNNLSLAHYLLGQRGEAVETAERVLQLSPDNLHALAYLVQWRVQSGNLAEAEKFSIRLKESQHDGAHRWQKVGRALSYMGDDQGVLDALSRAPNYDLETLEHYAAVAWARRGDWKRAKELWKRAAHKGLGVAQDNLANADLPLNQRHSAWAFGMHEWLDIKKLSRYKSEKILLKEVPELEALVPLLLDRGDPLATEFCLRLVRHSPSPTLLEALRKFALSRLGTDQLRLKAARICREAGVLPPEGVRLWQSGKWAEVMLLGFTLHWEPGEKIPRRAEKLKEAGVAALRQGRFAEAESLFQKGLVLAPNSPGLLNNLGVVYHSSGRKAMAMDLWRSIHEGHDDYPFATITLASIHVAQGDLTEARRLLKPVLACRQLHVSEFASLCEVHLQMADYEGSKTVRETWEKFWLELEGQDPEAARFRPSRLGGKRRHQLL
ncbi:tetratricopeptide repeat protein [bacterium]|nr:tetratricopeptide repeat protein [bacterium]